jgi:hypothetical protein
MSFNRTKYDKLAYELQMDRSTGELGYRLFGPFGENVNHCYSNNGPVGSKSDVSLARKQTDLEFGDVAQAESRLSWRNKKLNKYNDGTNPLEDTKLIHKSNCDNLVVSEDTRFTHPLDNYRGMSLTAYQMEPYLHVNPQCHIQSIFDKTGLNSRLSAKDNYVMPKQKYWDDYTLPKEIVNESCKI